MAALPSAPGGSTSISKAFPSHSAEGDGAPSEVNAIVQDVNPDLASERLAASFNTRQMQFLLDGDFTGKKTAAKEQIRALIPKSESVFDKSKSHFLSRKERFARNLKLHRRLNELVQEHGLSMEKKHILLGEVEGLATGTHDLIFAGGIRSLGDEEQQRQWMPRCISYEVIGAYAQTELGHGSNLRRLETVAHYDVSTEEFELHSPTLTSSKWWPGSLGACATHALVFAILHLNGEELGMHAFIVPIRDPATHKPLPGIQVGDIGPKLGMNTIDNGFLRLTHVRVPRRNMLSKHSQVAPDGTYTPAKSRQMNYGTMLLARVSYIQSAMQNLAAATTIATRYACVRRQGGSGNSELKIMDWRTHQRKLLPTISTAYAFHYAGIALHAMHRRIMDGDYSEIGSVHIVVSAVKTMVTSMASLGMELCRRSCGGHGYSLSSGIPDKWATFTHTTTAEGDNTIMALQVAKGVIKLIGAESPSYLQDPATFLAEPCPGNSARDFNAEVGLECLRHRACRLTCELAESQQQRRASTKDSDEAWNADLPLAERLGKAHAEFVMAELFVNGLQEQIKRDKARGVSGAGLHEVLQRLCSLFVLDLVEQSLGDLLEDGYMMGKVNYVREAISQLLTDLRPDSVALVDSFNLTDYSLESCIGRWDGNVYDALWDHAQLATEYLCTSGPDGVVDGWREGIAPSTNPAQPAARL